MNFLCPSPIHKFLSTNHNVGKSGSKASNSTLHLLVSLMINKSVLPSYICACEEVQEQLQLLQLTSLKGVVKIAPTIEITIDKYFDKI